MNTVEYGRVVGRSGGLHLAPAAADWKRWPSAAAEGARLVNGAALAGPIGRQWAASRLGDETSHRGWAEEGAQRRDTDGVEGRYEKYDDY